MHFLCSHTHVYTHANTITKCKYTFPHNNYFISWIFVLWFFICFCFQFSVGCCLLFAVVISYLVFVVVFHVPYVDIFHLLYVVISHLLFVVVGPNTFSLLTIRLLSHLFQLPAGTDPVRGQQTSGEQSGCKCVSGIHYWSPPAAITE